MNAPTPGWNPDPTGRHEYRYWDGTRWTDDVSDNGVTSVDPVDGGAADATAPLDPTQQYGAAGGGYGAQPGYGQGPTSGQYPGQPVRSGPSTGLIVGLAAVAVVLIVGIVFLVTRDGGDDDAATDDTTTTSEPEDDTTTTEDDTSTTGGDEVDPIVSAMAEGIVEGSGGQVTQEQAECAAQAMLDELGLGTLIDIGASGEDPFTSGALTDEQTAAVINAMLECIPADVLMDMGAEDVG